jgi:hypothetical protein
LLLFSALESSAKGEELERAFSVYMMREGRGINAMIATIYTQPDIQLRGCCAKDIIEKRTLIVNIVELPLRDIQCDCHELNK